jgi:hypothetical protein
MFRTSLRPYYVMGAVIAALLAITGGAGVLVEGLYRPFLSEPLVAFQFWQDLVSLLFAPLLVAAMVRTARGSVRAFVIWTGLLVYTLYYYAFYVFDFVYTAYYPLYLALVGLAAYSLIGLLTSVDPCRFCTHVGQAMPVRLIGGVLGTTLLFVPIWLIGVAQSIARQQPGETDLVFVFDLPFLIPACVVAAVQVWRRRPLGYLLSGPLLVKAVASGVLLTGGELLKLQRGLPLAIEQLAMYLVLAVVGGAGLALYLRHLHMDQGAAARCETTLRPMGQPSA